MGNFLSQTYPGVAPALTQKNLPNQAGKARSQFKTLLRSNWIEESMLLGIPCRHPQNRY
jgi:NAD(P)-dependent dehydrogenase (short-subunit alcohol dehydrogenase family)